MAPAKTSSALASAVPLSRLFSAGVFRELGDTGLSRTAAAVARDHLDVERVASHIAEFSLAGLGSRGNYKVPATTPASLCLAGVHWRTAEALLATGQTDKAREHFQTASDLDPQSKCGARCREKLEHLGASAG